MTAAEPKPEKRKIVRNWRRILTHGWSMHCVYLAAALQIAVSTLPYVADFIPWWTAVLVLIAAPVARIISQGGLDGDDQA